MAIQGVGHQGTGQSQTVNNVSTPTQQETDALDQSQFLSMLLAQIENQDPLNPQDSAEFTSQLAQITTVENLESINKQIEGLAQSLQLSQSMNARALIGEKVLVPSSVMSLEDNGQLTGEVQVPANSQALILNVYDGNKQLVDTLNLGAVPAGQINFTSEELSSGTYTVTGTILVDGEQYAVPVNLAAEVQSVTLPQDGNETQITVAGIGTMPLSVIQKIGN